MKGVESLEWAYVWEVMDREDRRSNQKIILRLTDLELDDAHVFFDETEGRPERAKLLDKLQAGDCLSVRSVEDLADTLPDLETVLQRLTDKQITLYSCEEPYLNGTNFLEIYRGVVRVYLSIQHKQRSAAYKRAVVAGTVGRPTKAREIEQAVTMYQTGKYKIAQIEKITGVSKSTIYRYLERGSQ